MLECDPQGGLRPAFGELADLGADLVSMSALIAGNAVVCRRLVARISTRACARVRTAVRPQVVAVASAARVLGS